MRYYVAGIANTGKYAYTPAKGFKSIKHAVAYAGTQLDSIYYPVFIVYQMNKGEYLNHRIYIGNTQDGTIYSVCSPIGYPVIDLLSNASIAQDFWSREVKAFNPKQALLYAGKTYYDLFKTPKNVSI